MAEPIRQFDAEAVADQIEALDANIAELDAQLLKLRAVTQAAIRSDARRGKEGGAYTNHCAQ